MKYLMKIEGLAGRPPYDYDLYLRWFRPENLKDDRPMIAFTEHKSEAQQFDTLAELMEFWRTSIGTRPDGKPDRPLTAWTVSTVTHQPDEEKANV